MVFAFFSFLPVAGLLPCSALFCNLPDYLEGGQPYRGAHASRAICTCPVHHDSGFWPSGIMMPPSLAMISTASALPLASLDRYIESANCSLRSIYQGQGSHRTLLPFCSTTGAQCSCHLPESPPLLFSPGLSLL